MNIHRLRRIAMCALMPAALAVAGCQDLTTAPSGNTGGTTSTGNPQEIAQIQQALDAEAYTAAGTVTSDFELDGGIGTLPVPSIGVGAQSESLLFHRIILSSTRSRTVTQSGDSANVLIVEDRTGTLKIGQRGAGAQLERPFSDHGMRTATLIKQRGHWMVTASSFLDRASTSVTAPLRIDAITFTPDGGTAQTYTSPTELIGRDAWPTMPVRRVAIDVRVSGASDAGARVFLHDRYGDGVAEHHKIELARDAADPTLFHGTWDPNPRRGDAERAWRRLLTVDVLDATTLSLDPAAAYNAHQWILPVAFRRPAQNNS